MYLFENYAAKDWGSFCGDLWDAVAGRKVPARGEQIRPGGASPDRAFSGPDAADIISKPTEI